MMAQPTGSGMSGTICKECNRPIKDHTPAEFLECQRKQEAKRIAEGDGT